MKTLVRVVTVLIIVGGVVAGGWWYYQTRLAPDIAEQDANLTQTVAVQRGNLRASISLVGELYAGQQEDLTFDRLRSATPLLTLEVEAGHTVEEGQVLATVDITPYQQALDEAESDLQEAEDALAELQTPATDLEIARADLSVAQAELRLAQAEDSLASLREVDLADLEQTLVSARDSLTLARLQQSLTDSDELYDSERELLYGVDWHERRINELRQLVSSGRANLEQTEELAQQQEDLVETRAELARVREELQLAEEVAAAEVAEAEAAEAEASDALEEAQAGPSELDLAKTELAVEEATVNLAQARLDRDNLDVGVDSVSLAAARASVDKKRLAYNEAQADLEAATLKAPFSGTVLDTYVSPGNLLTSNRTVLTIANLQNLQVLTSVDETTIRQVAVGQAAQISFDAFPGQTFSGQVLSVPLQGALQGDVMVYQVPVSLEGAEELPLLVGMTANVNIQVGEVEDGLLVPAMALLNVGGFYQVLVPGGSDPQAAPQSVPVEIGLSNGVYTQIVRGLNEGDQVLVQMQEDQGAGFGFGAMRMLGGQVGGFRAR